MLRARSLRTGIGLLWLVTLGACVTINVYFPAAAAEQAADRIIDEVWGKDGPRKPEPSSRLDGRRMVAAALDWLVPAARAQSADIDISSPAIAAIRASMRARHPQLAPFYESGAVGLTDDGRLAVRDARAVPLRDRQRLKGLVAAENRDRDALYREIARANGHPEWESEIRATFARRWIERARPGWWYRRSGRWVRR